MVWPLAVHGVLVALEKSSFVTEFNPEKKLCALPKMKRQARPVSFFKISQNKKTVSPFVFADLKLKVQIIIVF